MAKSQWDIVTKGELFARDPAFKAHKVKPGAKFMDMTAKRKRPNGEMMTDVEWAVYALSRKKGARAYSACRCHGKCECFARKPDNLEVAIKQAEATGRPFEVVTQYGVTRIKFLDVTEADIEESSVPCKTLYDLRKREK